MKIIIFITLTTAKENGSVIAVSIKLMSRFVMNKGLIIVASLSKFVIKNHQ
jgi:hypothetical protein